jgi:hypothetical protein
MYWGEVAFYLAMVHPFLPFFLQFLPLCFTFHAFKAFPWNPLFLGTIYNCTPTHPPTSSIYWGTNVAAA